MASFYFEFLLPLLSHLSTFKFWNEKEKEMKTRTNFIQQKFFKVIKIMKKFFFVLFKVMKKVSALIKLGRIM